MLLGKWSSLLGDRLGRDGSSEHQDGMPGSAAAICHHEESQQGSEAISEVAAWKIKPESLVTLLSESHPISGLLDT